MKSWKGNRKTFKEGALLKLKYNLETMKLSRLLSSVTHEICKQDIINFIIRFNYLRNNENEQENYSHQI